MSYFFAGDTSFTEGQLLENAMQGIVMQPDALRQTLANIRTYGASHPTVYLPSHDPASRTRLQHRQTLPVDTCDS